MNELRIENALPQSLCHRHRTSGVSFQQHDGKFLSADTSEQVGVSNDFTAESGNPAQYAISRSMTIGVIDQLEVIDIQHQQAAFSPVPLYPVQFFIGPQPEMTPVKNAGQAINCSLSLQLLLQSFTLGDVSRYAVQAN